jgi:hypothetical protein
MERGEKQMNTYKINVSRDNGKRYHYGDRTVVAWQHYFHVKLDNRFTDKRAMEVAADIKKRFPADEGFKVDLAQWTVPVGNDIEIVEE